MELKIGKSVVIFAVLSVLIFYSNEIITGIVDLQNTHIATIFGGDHVVVDTMQGKLRGFTSLSRDGRPFYEFLSVPFALPPVGDLRFEPPVAFPAWSGIRDALSYGHRCLQYDYLISMYTGNEDCLTLHVYTPSEKVINPKSDSGLLPVIVFIYGGMFMFGRTEVYRPEYFMDTDAVLVTVNYRLGPLGFLNTDDEVVRGNMGLKDQLQALKWIKDNIRSFGGDPNLVTLMGESAGGASVHYHMFSPASKGLFHRAISLSGSSLNEWAFAKNPKEQSIHFGKSMGCPTNNSMELVKCLKALDSDTIVTSFKEARDQFHNPLAAFAPSVESIKDERTFISEHPRVTLSNGKVINNVPWLLGVNDQEGMIYAGDILFNKTSAFLLSKQWFVYAPRVFKYEHASKVTKKKISKALWNYYFPQEKQLRFHTSLHNLSAIFSDIHFYKPLRDTVELQANMTNMYLYYYQYQASHGLGQVSLKMTGILPVVLDGLIGQGIRYIFHHLLGIQENHLGACHTDELGVTFQLPLVINKIRPGSKDYKFSKKFVDLLAYFAKHGESPAVDGRVWPTVRKSARHYMKLDESPEIMLEPFEERVDFVSRLLADV